MGGGEMSCRCDRVWKDQCGRVKLEVKDRSGKGCRRGVWSGGDGWVEVRAAEARSDKGKQAIMCNVRVRQTVPGSPSSSCNQTFMTAFVNRVCPVPWGVTWCAVGFTRTLALFYIFSLLRNHSWRHCRKSQYVIWSIVRYFEIPLLSFVLFEV